LEHFSLVVTFVVRKPHQCSRLGRLNWWAWYRTRRAGAGWHCWQAPDISAVSQNHAQL